MGVSIACRTVGLERVWGCQLHVEQWEWRVLGCLLHVEQWDCRVCGGVYCM